jgi:prolyl-tRNA synthetase
VPIWRSQEDRAKVLEVGHRVREELRSAGIRVEVDDREGLKPGAKYYEWEGRGAPLRLEIGPRDVASEQVMIARRTGGKEPAKLAGLAGSVAAALEDIQKALFDAAVRRREANSIRNVGKDQLIEFIEGPGGFAYGGFCGGEDCEMAIKGRTKATIRVLPDEEFRTDPAPETCAWCGKPSVSEAVWAKAY